MLKPTLQLKLGQTLTMTPQLQQAIRLLQLPVLDLNAQIQDALEENIMLEMEDLPDVPRTSFFGVAFTNWCPCKCPCSQGSLSTV